MDPGICEKIKINPGAALFLQILHDVVFAEVTDIERYAVLHHQLWRMPSLRYGTDVILIYNMRTMNPDEIRIIGYKIRINFKILADRYFFAGRHFKLRTGAPGRNVHHLVKLDDQCFL